MATIALNIPGSNQVGTPSDVSSLDLLKTFVVGGTFGPGEVIVIEGTADPAGVTGWNGIASFNAPTKGQVNQPITFTAPTLTNLNTQPVACVVAQMRVRRVSGLTIFGAAPTVSVDAQAVTQKNFAQLDVPSVAGNGNALDVSLFGPLVQFTISGTFGAGETMLIKGSQDGVVYDTLQAFVNSSPMVSVFQSRYNFIRVTRQTASANAIVIFMGAAFEAPVASAQNIQNFQSQVSVANSTNPLTYGLLYFWGVGQLDGGIWGPSGGAISPTNVLWARPHIFTKSVVIKDIVMDNVISGANIGSLYKLGIYDNVGITTPYPRNLIAQWAEQAPLQNGIVTWSPNLAVPAGTLLWIVETVDAAHPAGNNFAGIGGTSKWQNILGIFDNMANNPIVGWGQAKVYDGTLPAVFPTTVPTLLRTNSPNDQSTAFCLRFR